MTIKNISRSSLAGGVALVLGLLTLDAEVAAAQATDLVCSQCVGTSDIANGAVTNAKLAPNAVSNSKIANGSVTAAKLAANAVSNAKLANAAASTGKLTTAAVTTPKLAPNAVKTTKIANAAVTAAKIAPGAVNQFKIADGVVTLDKLNRKNLILVEAAGPTAADNCSALMTALAGITDNSASNRYLVQLGPGTYDCGATRLMMKEFVDLAGSGMMTTKIVGQKDDFFFGIVALTDNMELRDVSVENQSATNASGNLAIDVYNALGVRMTRVRADAGTAPGTFSCGVVVTGSDIDPSNITIVDSILRGLADAIAVDLFNTANIVKTQLHAENDPNFPTGSSGDTNCVKSYNNTFVELLSTCDVLI